MLKPNPGSVFDRIDPCHVCNKEVAYNHHGLLRKVCSYWIHHSWAITELKIAKNQ